MATIKTFNITAVELDKVKFTYSADSGEYTKTASSGGYTRVTEKRTETTSWSFSTTGGTSIASPCSYTQGGNGETAYSLEAVLNTIYTVTEYGWVQTGRDYEVLKEDLGLSKTYYYQTSRTRYRFSEKNDSGYAYEVYYDTWDIKDESSDNTTTDSATINFYPHPAKFTFNNCVAKKQWKVEEGINSLITNITDFQGQAQQRKNWKHQLDENFSKYGQCPSFFNNDNIMTRNQMNAVYRYVKEESSNYEEFKKEDEKGNLIYYPISAKMFNDLADIINK